MSPRPSMSRLQETAESIVRRLDDREKEREIWYAAKEENFTGRVTDVMSWALARYGMDEIAALIRTGLIHPRTAEYRDPLRRDFRRDDDEIEGMVELIVTHGLRKFLQDARDGRGWCPDGASGLPGFFRGACLMVAGQARKEWLPAHDPQLLLLHEPLPERGELSTQLDDVEIADFIRRHSDLVDEDIVRLFRMKLDKCTTTEIAQTLGTSPKAVEGRWARLKKKLRRNSRDERG